MRLLVVYGLATTDYDWLARFYPARRIAEECANRGIPLRFLFPRDIPLFPDALTLDRLFADPAIDSFPEARPPIILIRGNVDVETVARLEKAGCRCVNSARAMALANDKLESARFLARHGFPTPVTLPAADVLDANGPLTQEESGFPIAFPFILKPRRGSRGVGVALIETEEGLSRWKEGHRGERRDDWVAQEFVASSRGRDIRFFFAGGEVLAVAGRRGPSGSFLSNASVGGRMRLLKASGRSLGRWADMALEIAREAGLWYGTVDFLYRKGGALTVCEINASPGFEALERDCALNVAGSLIERLARDFGEPSPRAGMLPIFPQEGP